jgi:nucleoside-diphosphate-sugar epimerase
LSTKNIFIYALINKSKVKKKNKNITYIKGNIKKIETLPNDIDCLVHLAVKNPENTSGPKLFKENIQISEKIFSLAKKGNIKKIIFFSSIAVYEKVTKTLIKENIKLKNPSSYYAASKLESEILLKKKFFKTPVSIIIIRLPSIIGKGSRFNSISEIRQKIIKKKKIFISNPNLEYNRIIHISNLNNFILTILRDSKKIKTTFHLASSKPIPFKSIILMMFHYLKKKINIKILKDQSTQILDISKAKKFGFKDCSVKHTLNKYLLS